MHYNLCKSRNGCILLPFSTVSDFLLGFKKMKKDSKALSTVFWKRGRARKRNIVTGLGFFTYIDCLQIILWRPPRIPFIKLSPWHPLFQLAQRENRTFFSHFLSRNIFRVVAFSLFNLQIDESISLVMLLMTS